MDVTCENCGTEYEFDDSKVTVAGITVKCTHCGHLFRVAKAAPADAPTATPPTRTRHWMIRNRHGEIREFRDLSTLQQWIVARKVSRDDEISKTGETWKKLGSIVELAGVFSAVDSASSVGDLFSSPGRELHSSAPPSAAPPPFGPDEVIPTGKFTLEGPRRVPAGMQDGPAVRITRGHAQVQAQPQPVISQSLPEQRALSLPEVQQPSYTPPPASNSGRGFLLGVMTTLALAGAVYFIYDAFLRRDEPAPAAPVAQRTDAVVSRGEALYEKDTEADFAKADAQFAEALRQLGEPPSDPRLALRAHFGRARIALARAEYARFNEADNARALRIAGLALDEAERLERGSVVGRLLRADLHRISNKTSEAQALLADLQVPTALVDEKQLIQAAVPLQRGDWLAARAALAALPEAALEKPRGRFLYAAALARAGRTQDAIFELDRLLTRQPGHEAAARLLTALRPKAPATVKAIVTPASNASAGSGAPASGAPASVAPASVASKAVASKAPATAAPGSAASTAKAPAAAPKSTRKPAPRGFDALMKSARRAQENGKTTQARRLLLQALSSKPNNAEALSSLGWCDVDEGDFRRAISYFRRALRRANGFAEARYGLAVALERAGQTAEAKRIYNEYLQRHPKGRHRRIVERKAKTL